MPELLIFAFSSLVVGIYVGIWFSRCERDIEEEEPTLNTRGSDDVRFTTSYQRRDEDR